MHYEISCRRQFSAAHQLKLYDGSLEPLHGHNWVIIVTVAAGSLDEIGVVMDFHDLERRIDQVTAGWHNHHLNDLEAFASINPSAENVALILARRLKLPPQVKLVCVEVWETTDNRAKVVV